MKDCIFGFDSCENVWPLLTGGVCVEPGGVLLGIFGGGVPPASPFPFLSQQLLALVAEKKNKFISCRERSPDNHTQFQTKMFKFYTRFQTKTAQKPYPLGRHIPIYLT